MPFAAASSCQVRSYCIAMRNRFSPAATVWVGGHGPATVVACAVAPGAVGDGPTAGVDCCVPTITSPPPSVVGVAPNGSDVPPSGAWAVCVPNTSMGPAVVGVGGSDSVVGVAGGWVGKPVSPTGV